MLELNVLPQQLRVGGSIIALQALVRLEVEVDGVDVVGEVGLGESSNIFITITENSGNCLNKIDPKLVTSLGYSGSLS